MRWVTPSPPRWSAGGGELVISRLIDQTWQYVGDIMEWPTIDWSFDWLTITGLAEPEPCDVPEGVTVELGPQNWHHEMIPQHAGIPVGFFTMVCRRWDEFTAHDFPAPESPGYDFSAQAADEEQHGPARRIDGRRKNRRK